MGDWGKLQTRRMYDPVVCGRGCKKSRSLLVLLLVHLGCGDVVLLSDVGIPCSSSSGYACDGAGVCAVVPVEKSRNGV